eukprot:9631807-Ditylum_brightwellii.AAC.3
MMSVCCVRGLAGLNIAWCLCWCVVIVGLGGSPVNNRNGRGIQRDKEDLGVQVLGEVILLAHDVAGGGRFDGSITC